METTQLAQSAHATAEALRALIRTELDCFGRPSRQSRARAGQLSGAPAPELLILPADQLNSKLATLEDPDLLLEIFAWERSHERRRSVLRTIQRRLRRRFGVYVGGPDSPPWPDFEELAVDELRLRLREIEPARAARAYAYEWYRNRRRPVLRLLEARAGSEACERAIEETLAGDPEELPFPGYDTLQASPQGRAHVREMLSRATREQLVAALEFERRTKRRKVIERALRSAIRARTLRESEAAA